MKHHLDIGLDLLGQLGRKKIKALSWLVEQADNENQVLATYTEIAQGAGVSERTVGDLLRILKEANVITETRRTLWRFNPSVVFQGGHDRRTNVLGGGRPVVHAPCYVQFSHRGFAAISVVQIRSVSPADTELGPYQPLLQN